MYLFFPPWMDLSNAGGESIVQTTLDFWKAGRTREEMELKDLETSLSLSVFNNNKCERWSHQDLSLNKKPYFILFINLFQVAFFIQVWSIRTWWTSLCRSCLWSTCTSSSAPWLKWKPEIFHRTWTWQTRWPKIWFISPNPSECSPSKAARRSRASWTSTLNASAWRTPQSVTTCTF